jgi:hypothetical protein
MGVERGGRTKRTVMFAGVALRIASASASTRSTSAPYRSRAFLQIVRTLRKHADSVAADKVMVCQADEFRHDRLLRVCCLSVFDKPCLGYVSASAVTPASALHPRALTPMVEPRPSPLRHLPDHCTSFGGLAVGRK